MIKLQVIQRSCFAALLTFHWLAVCDRGRAESKPASTTKPNIVIAIADDLTWRDVGCYGNGDIHTPHIDRLASEGMRFTHMFTATAMCAPTRQQLYTGLFPVRNGAYPNHSRVHANTKSIVHYLKALGYRVGLAGKKHFGPADVFAFEEVSGKGQIDFGAIGEFIDRDEAQPYCLVLASNQPHAPWDRGDASAYPPKKLKVPPYLIDTPETRRALSQYYAEITYLDDQIGRCMKLVKKSGGQDNTIVIFTSEQGSQLPFGKWTCYDLGLKTAFIVRWPARIKAGTATDAMAQYVDVVPTLIEAAGGAIPPRLDGRSFLAVLEGKADELRDLVYGVHTTRGIINGSDSYPVRSVRSRRYKYIWNPAAPDSHFSNIIVGEKQRPNSVLGSWARAGDAAAKRARDYEVRPERELYDLATDPFEMKNLSADPRHRALMDEMHAKLQAWMAQQGDEGIATELLAKERQGGRRRNAKKRSPAKG